MKKYILMASLALGITATNAVWAQTQTHTTPQNNTGTGPTKEDKKDMKAEKKEMKAEKKKMNGSERKAMKKEIKADVKENKSDIKEEKNK